MLKIFIPPIMQDSENTRKAQVLFNLAWGTMIIITSVVTSLWFTTPQYSFRYFSAICIINLGGVVCIALNMKGYTRKASILFLCLLYAAIYGFAWTGGGISALVYQLLPATILLAGLLLGWKEGVITTFVAVFGGFGLVLAQNYSVLPKSQVTFQPIHQWMFSIAYVGLLALLQYVSVKNLNNALQQARNELTLRINADEKLRSSEEFRKHVFESSRVPIVVMDAATNKYIDCNQAAVEIYRYPTHEDTLGRSPVDFSAPIQYDGTSSEEKAKYYIEKALTEGSVVFEWKHQRSDGEFWDAEVHLMGFEIDNRKLLQFTLTDITVRKNSEKEIKSLKEYFESVFNFSPLAISISRFSDGQLVNVNQMFTDFTGWAREEVIGKTSTYLQLWANTEEQKEFLDCLVEKGFCRNKETVFRKKDGHLRNQLLSSTVVDFLGIPHVITISLDITERKTTELKLKESELKFRTLFENAGDSILLMENDKFIDCNISTLKMFGCETRNQIIGFPPYMFSPKFQSDGRESKDLAIEKINSALSGQPQFFEWIHTKIDGRQFPAEVTLNKIEFVDKVLLQAIVRDITQRKLMENTLRENEDRMKAIVEGTPHLFFYIQDKDANTKYVSPTVEQITGYSSDTWRQRKDWFITDSIINQNIIEKTRAHLQGIFTKRPEIIEVRHSNGNPILLEVYEYPIVKDRKIVGLQGVAHDVTARKLAEDELNNYKNHLEQMVEERTSELEESRETFRALAENTRDVIIRVNTEHQILYVNNAIKEVFGVPTENYLGKTLSELKFPQNLAENFETILKNIIKTKQNRHIEFKLPNGIWSHMLITPEFDLSGNVCTIIVHARDITELKKLHMDVENALAKEKELNQLKNRFISVISHEYRTPLTSIQSSIEILEMGGVNYPEEKKTIHYNRIQKNIKYLVSMIDEVLYVNRIDSDRIQISMQKINIQTFCEEIFNEIKEMYPNINSELKFMLTESYYTIETSLMKKVLFNLIFNAFKYIKEEGKVDFVIESKMNKLIFTVRDTGIGIPEEEQKNAFEPFTRMSNSKNIKGTGLGLSIVKKSLEQIGGTISFESKLNKGTTFTVEINV